MEVQASPTPSRPMLVTVDDDPSVSRAVARDLAVEIVGREHSHAHSATLAGIVSLSAGLEPVRDQPAVGVNTTRPIIVPARS